MGRPGSLGLYSPYLGSVYGGGEKYLLSAARALADAGCGVELIAPVPVDAAAYRRMLGADLRGISLRSSNARVTSLHRALNRIELLRPLRNRVLGVQASRIGADYDVFIPMVYAIPVAPSGRRNAMLCQFPYGSRDEIAGFELLVCQSEYVRGWVQRYWDRDALVVNPPIDVPETEPDWAAKEQVILSVGRFFSGGHSKRQDVLVDAFRELVDGGLRGWELHLAGAVHRDAQHAGYFDAVAERAQGYPIGLHPDAGLDELEGLYRTASIYWHAAGFGADEARHPERLEHFGMTTAEAMAHGAVPVVFGAGGQVEVVRDGETGRHWHSLDELKQVTRDLIGDEPQRVGLGQVARAASGKWSREAFGPAIVEALRPVLPCGS